MKARPDNFLAPDKLPHDGEIFDYIKELHEYLWKFVRFTFPGASGNLHDYLDDAIETGEFLAGKALVSFTETELNSLDSLLSQAENQLVPYNADPLIMANQAIREMQKRIVAARSILYKKGVK